jgi:hypothetical protein
MQGKRILIVCGNPPGLIGKMGKLADRLRPHRPAGRCSLFNPRNLRNLRFRSFVAVFGTGMETPWQTEKART